MKIALIVLNLLAGACLPTAILVATHVAQVVHAMGTCEKLDQAQALDRKRVAEAFPDTAQDAQYLAVLMPEPRHVIVKRGWPISAVFYANALVIGLSFLRKTKPQLLAPAVERNIP